MGVAFFVRAGEMKAYAATKLAGPDSDPRKVVADWTLGEPGDAHRRDVDAGTADMRETVGTPPPG